MWNEKKFRENVENVIEELESEMFKQECAKMLSDESYDKKKLDDLYEKRDALRDYLNQ